MFYAKIVPENVNKLKQNIKNNYGELERKFVVNIGKEGIGL